MDFSRGDLHKRSLTKRPASNFTLQVDSFLPIFLLFLQETAGRSGRRTGRKGSRNHQTYHPPLQWHHNSLVVMLKASRHSTWPPNFGNIKTLWTFKFLTKNPMAPTMAWVSDISLPCCFFVEHSYSLTKGEMSWWSQQDSRHAQSCSNFFGNILWVVVVEQHGCFACFARGSSTIYLLQGLLPIHHRMFYQPISCSRNLPFGFESLLSCQVWKICHSATNGRKMSPSKTTKKRCWMVA